MGEPIVVYGTGGLGREVAELISDITRTGRAWDVLGLITDDQSAVGQVINGLSVLGGQEWLSQNTGIAVAVAVGNAAARRRIISALEAAEIELPVLEHPSVQRGRDVDIGPGTILCAGTIITTNVRIGRSAFVNLSCTIGHDAVLRDFVTLAPGVHVSGNVTIHEGVDIGTGASIIQGISIGPWSIIGAGAAVVSSIRPNVTAVGVPARVIKERAEGWHLN
jgi:sugar O-acyltransferase (sialic acid O-acetyltransferase NeuD family)